MKVLMNLLIMTMTFFKKKDEPVKEEVKPVPSITTTKEIVAGICFHCRRSGTEFRCAKGDNNQYKFCSIECFNADTTV